MKQFAESFYKSSQWQSMRDYIYKRDKGLCQDCLKQGIVTGAEEVHHIIPITSKNIHDVNITLNEGNLISLCRSCHQVRHKRKERRYTVDAFGRVSPL